VEADQLLLLPLWYIVFLLSVTCHEGAHAWAAYRGGDPTAYLGGQVSLNPLPHVQREMFGTVIVPLLTYLQMHWMMGWASAPYDPAWEDRHPRRAAWMALAGPLANLGLAGLAFMVLKIGLGAGIWIPAVTQFYEVDQLVSPAREGFVAVEGLGRLCSILFSLNLVLFVFNLIPLPPMDGASVLAGLFEPARRARDRLREMPLAGLGGLVVAWFLFPHLFWPLYLPIVHFLWR